MSPAFDRVIQRFSDRCSSYFNGSRGVDFALRAPDGTEHRFGNGHPAFTLAAADDRGLQALCPKALPARVGQSPSESAAEEQHDAPS